MDQINSGDVNEVEDAVSTGNYGYVVREAVGVFSTREALERALCQLPCAAPSCPHVIEAHARC